MCVSLSKILTGLSVLKGKVSFKHGEMYIIQPSAITVSDQDLFDTNGEISYDRCDAWCSTSWENQPYQCVKVIESDDETANPNDYLCCVVVK